MLKVKAWFINKMESDYQRRAIVSGATYSIVKETEKAYRLNADTKYGNIEFWCPKSCTYIDEFDELTLEEQKQIRAEEAAEMEAKWESGLAYNQMLKELAASKGLKVRKNMKTVTVIDMLKNAGLEVPTRA